MKMKKQDLLLAAAILIIAVAALLIFRVFYQSGEVVKVTVDGEIYGTYNLKENQIVEIKTKYGTNTLTIQDGEANMTQADCPDQICVKESPLNDDTPRTIVCLPHKIIVEIQQKSFVSNI